MPSQTVSGKGFEYALATELSSTFEIDIVGDAQVAARRAYDLLTDDERSERNGAASAALSFLSQREPRFGIGNIVAVKIQPDSVARRGDVRDLVVITQDGVKIGISAKNRNRAIRNSRLSPTINFGERWFQSQCSTRYFNDIAPIFDYLESLEQERMYWRCLPEKEERVYVPLLHAFIDETQRIFNRHPARSASGMMRYMLGTDDYYKVFKQNGDVSVESFNMDGTLNWGNELPMPDRLVDLSVRPGSQTTALMVLDAGWQLSFRIHNATSLVERSLKFDIQIIGQPPQLSQHHIQYR